MKESHRFGITWVSKYFYNFQKNLYFCVLSVFKFLFSNVLTLLFSFDRLSIIICWQRRSTRSRRNWKRRGGPDYRSKVWTLDLLAWDSPLLGCLQVSEPVGGREEMKCFSVCSKSSAHAWWTHSSLTSSFSCPIFTDGPLTDPVMVRPAGPNQMNRTQGPGKTSVVAGTSFYGGIEAYTDFYFFIHLFIFYLFFIYVLPNVNLEPNGLSVMPWLISAVDIDSWSSCTSLISAVVLTLMTKALELSVFALMLTQPPRVLITLKNKIHVKYVYVVYHKFCVLSGMNQFNQMGIQSMGQRSTPPLPLGPSGNQVSTHSVSDIIYLFIVFATQ